MGGAGDGAQPSRVPTPQRVTCPQCPQSWGEKAWSKVTFRFQNIQWVSAPGPRVVPRQLELREDELMLTQHVLPLGGRRADLQSQASPRARSRSLRCVPRESRVGVTAQPPHRGLEGRWAGVPPAATHRQSPHTYDGMRSLEGGWGGRPSSGLGGSTGQASWARTKQKQARSALLPGRLPVLCAFLQQNRHCTLRLRV